MSMEHIERIAAHEIPVNTVTENGRGVAFKEELPLLISYGMHDGSGWLPAPLYTDILIRKFYVNTTPKRFISWIYNYVTSMGQSTYPVFRRRA